MTAYLAGNHKASTASGKGYRYAVVLDGRVMSQHRVKSKAVHAKNKLDHDLCSAENRKRYGVSYHYNLLIAEAIDESKDILNTCKCARCVELRRSGKRT